MPSSKHWIEIQLHMCTNRVHQYLCSAICSLLGQRASLVSLFLFFSYQFNLENLQHRKLNWRTVWPVVRQKWLIKQINKPIPLKWKTDKAEELIYQVCLRTCSTQVKSQNVCSASSLLSVKRFVPLMCSDDKCWSNELIKVLS